MRAEQGGIGPSTSKTPGNRRTTGRAINFGRTLDSRRLAAHTPPWTTMGQQARLGFFAKRVFRGEKSWSDGRPAFSWDCSCAAIAGANTQPVLAQLIGSAYPAPKPAVYSPGRAFLCRRDRARHGPARKHASRKMGRALRLMRYGFADPRGWEFSRSEGALRFLDVGRSLSRHHPCLGHAAGRQQGAAAARFAVTWDGLCIPSSKWGAGRGQGGRCGDARRRRQMVAAGGQNFGRE